MKHYTEEQWADFARQAVAANEVGKMQEHLAGCDECRRLLSVWRGVAAAAATERSYEPAEPVVKMARAAFALQARAKKASTLAGLSELIFDSLRQPLLAGVRSGIGASAASARQLMYRFADLMVDLRAERQPQSDRVVLVGQVLSQRDPTKSPGEAVVVLLRNERILGHAVANALGEFVLDFDDARDLRLFVDVDGHPGFVVDLSELKPVQPDHPPQAFPPNPR